MDDNYCRRAFDIVLSPDKLKESCPEMDIKQAYNNIDDYLKNLGFEENDALGYVSKEKLTNKQITSIFNDFLAAFPWLSVCTTKFDIINVGNTIDCSPMFEQKARRYLNSLKKNKEK